MSGLLIFAIYVVEGADLVLDVGMGMIAGLFWPLVIPGFLVWKLATKEPVEVER